MPNRRYAVPFDPDFFARRAAAGDPATGPDAFRLAYTADLWAGPESRSGAGAGLDQTAAIRRLLPALCRRLGVGTLLDLPCGDGSWITTVDFGPTRYIGADCVAELVDECTARYADLDREFRVLDLLSSPLPAADLLLCRDCLVHLSFADIGRAAANLRRSGIPYLLATTFTEQAANENVPTGDWRPLNLEAAPFHWPPPLELLVEECTEGGGLFTDKSLGLWRVESIPAASCAR